ncbi:tRNA adenosine(34) deaminase TadA [Agaribacterium sp. ZY112]|uniref:tRNA adenosine(34) deaminase TadA n=1 Tax=Agaribacterium sp. ZY112 TaxID=3233574 RepID=UPI0035264C48
MDEGFMRRALSLAGQAAKEGEVPVGAVLVIDGEVIAEASNKPIGHCDPSAHAEVLAIREACKKVNNYRLPGSTLYVTIEPCSMCLGTLVHARIERLVFGALEPKAGVIYSNQGLLNDKCFNHHFEVSSGVLAEPCSELISTFFSQRRAAIKAQKKAQKGCVQPPSPSS